MAKKIAGKGSEGKRARSAPAVTKAPAAKSAKKRRGPKIQPGNWTQVPGQFGDRPLGTDPDETLPRRQLLRFTYPGGEGRPHLTVDAFEALIGREVDAKAVPWTGLTEALVLTNYILQAAATDHEEGLSRVHRWFEQLTTEPRRIARAEATVRRLIHEWHNWEGTPATKTKLLAPFRLADCDHRFLDLKRNEFRESLERATVNPGGAGKRGTWRTLAELALDCGAFGVRQREGEDWARAMERATDRLKKSAKRVQSRRKLNGKGGDN